MEIRFEKTANSTDEMIIRFEQDPGTSGQSILFSDIDYSDDKIYQSLSAANQAAYRALAFGSYLKITAAEFTTLTTNLSGVTKASTSDTVYTAIGSSTNLATGNLFVTNIIDLSGSLYNPPIPANNYVFAVKFYYNSVLSDIRIFANNSTSSYTNFQQIGRSLPTTTAGQNYYVLKGASSVTANANGNLAVWASEIVYFGYKQSVNGSGIRYLQTAAPTSGLTLNTVFFGKGGSLGIQALTTGTRQWVA